jgi:vacuolar-type H+-ATPase subunit I/STV1
MAIAQMAKVIIVSHRTQASQLLEALQRDGICQILNAEEAMVSRDWPELAAAAVKPKDIEQLLGRLEKSITFLKDYAESQKGLAGVLAPRTVIGLHSYNDVVSDEEIPGIIDQCEQTETTIEKLKAECENLRATLEMLQPWASLQTPVEEIGRLRQTTCLAGLLPAQQFEQIQEQTGELGAVIQQIGTADNRYACLALCLNENLNETQKLLRSVDFEPVNFEPMTGTVAELISEHTKPAKAANSSRPLQQPVR